MNRIMRHLKPSVGVALARISAMGIDSHGEIQIDIYYVGRKNTHQLFPLLRKLWEQGFIPYWEYVGAVNPQDSERGFIAIGDVEAPTMSIDELADRLNEMEE